MKKRNIFVGALMVCAMVGITSCNELGAGYDNPIGSYMTVDEQVFVGVGKTVSINPSTISDGNVLYTSSDETVATVDPHGNVTGHKCGAVQITASVEETKGYYASKAVSNVQVCVEDGEQLAIELKNQKDYGWISVPLAPDAKIELPKGLTLPASTVNFYSIDEDKPATIKVDRSFVIQNSFQLSAVNVDASELTKPLIQLAKTGSESIYYIGYIEFYKVTVKDLKYQLIDANKEANCLVNYIYINNSVIGIDGTNKKPVIDFNQAGNYANLNVYNSTIYANPALAVAGGFIKTQQAKKINDYFGTNQNTNIGYSTFYNISYGQNFCTQVENNKSWLNYSIYNNIFVNCGKKGQVLKALGGNAGNKQQNSSWWVNNNLFNFDGEDTREQELVGNYESADAMNSLYGVVKFKDAAKGDFTQSDTWVGDPRWRE